MTRAERLARHLGRQPGTPGTMPAHERELRLASALVPLLVVRALQAGLGLAALVALAMGRPGAGVAFLICAGVATAIVPASDAALDREIDGPP